MVGPLYRRGGREKKIIYIPKRSITVSNILAEEEEKNKK
jgi:hypothetical protein